MADPQQQAFAGAVRPQDDAARASGERERQRPQQLPAVQPEDEVLDPQRQDRSRGDRRRVGHAGIRRLIPPAIVAAPLTSSDSRINRKPSPRASARLPLLVSSAMVVVITRVTWSMLPPTIITAPTSALARPKPASSAVGSVI